MLAMETGLKLRERYISLKRNRPATILLTNQEYFSLDYKYNHQPVDACVEPRVEKISKCVVKCRATKMDGNICNAKVKEGEFCKRHSKQHI
jgi:hypothetical protein